MNLKYMRSLKKEYGLYTLLAVLNKKHIGF